MPLVRTSKARVRVNLSTPGEWVEIPETIGGDVIVEQQRKLRNCIGVDAEGNPILHIGDMDMLKDVGTLELIVAKWSFEGDPIKARTLSMLTPEDRELIHSAARKLYPLLYTIAESPEDAAEEEAAEAKNSQPDGVNSSSGEATTFPQRSNGSLSATDSEATSTTRPGSETFESATTSAAGS